MAFIELLCAVALGPVFFLTGSAASHTTDGTNASDNEEAEKEEEEREEEEGIGVEEV